MTYVNKAEHSLLMTFVNPQHSYAGRLHINRKVKRRHLLHIHSQPTENNILNRALMRNNQQIFLVDIRTMPQAVYITAIKFIARFTAGIVAVIQLLLGSRLAKMLLSLFLGLAGSNAVIVLDQ